MLAHRARVGDAAGEDGRDYEGSLLEWNRDLMVNILSLEQYYGSYKRYEFESIIQQDFVDLHTCLAALRRDQKDFGCPPSKTNDFAAIELAIRRLNGELYCFVSGLPDKNVKCGHN